MSDEDTAEDGRAVAPCPNCGVQGSKAEQYLNHHVVRCENQNCGVYEFYNEWGL